MSRVLVLDARSGRLLAAIPVDAGSPHISPEEQITVDEQTGRVFVSHYSAGTVSMLDASVSSAP